MSGAQEYTPREFRSLWPEFDADSWAPWASVEDAMFGVEPEDTELVRRITGRERVPSDPVKEFWAIVGRGGGKSRFCARLAVYFACGRAYRRVPGERIFIGIFAPDRKQAGVMFRYVLGLLRAVPALERMVRRSLRESVDLDNGVTIEVITASKAAPRGRSYALAIVEEAAFLPADDATDPDKELLRALRPALARVPGSVLAVVSSPYARRGELWRTWKERFGKDDSDSVLVVQADTLTLNPAFDEREIERAYAEDPVAASAEYGAQFRTNVSGFISREAVEGCTVPGRRELPPVQGVSYTGFVDFAGGSGQDSATLAITHLEFREERSMGVLDLVREVRPPFSPEQVCRDFAGDLKRYRVTRATADRYAADFATEAMRRQGIDLKAADKAKTDLYREFLPALNSGGIELLDLPRLAAQLGGLERRVARGGRDSIDHAPGGHDDVANAVAGALVAIAEGKRRRWGIVLSARETAATGCADTSSLAERARQLGVSGSWDEMFRAVARAHGGEQQQAGSSAEEEFIPGGPQRIGML